MTKMIRSFSYIRFAVVMFIFTEVNAATHVGRSFHKRDSLLSRGSEHSEALGSSHNDSKRNNSNVSEVSLVHLMSAERNQRNSYKSSDEHVNIPDKQFLSTNIPREMDIAEVSFSTLSPLWDSDTRTLRPTSDHSSAPLIHYHQESSPPVSSTILGASPSTSNRSEVTSPSSFPPAGTQGVVSTEIPKAHEHRLAFLDKMLENYDKRAWPTYGTGGTPTLVYINIYINSLGSVNAANMEYSMDIYLRQMWHDPRLRLSRFGITEGVTLNGEDITENIWKPDLFFRNVKEANFHKVTVPNKLIKLSPEGNILFSMRLTLKLACHMSFRHYPLDTQRCHIVLGPYAQTMDQVIIEWQENDPIVIEQPLELPEFDVAGFSYSNFTRDIDTGSFSFLRVTFVMVRQNGYHLIQTYMPTFLIVMISWVSCWLNVDATPARVTLGVTTLLTLTTVASGIRTQLPPVSYVKAIDVWIGACSVMVFGALLEFTLVNYLSRSKLRPDEFKRSMNIFHWNKKIHLDHSMDGRMASENEIARNLKRARTVDRVSRVLFPLLFFTFNMIYWPYYLFTPD